MTTCLSGIPDNDGVFMTTSEPLASLPDIVADLSRELPRQARFQRLLEALENSFPCDATALLQLENGVLVPRAVRGLSLDTMGRRFSLDDHPRFREIAHSRGLGRFPADSSLPDPYDGLVDTPDHHLYVHDCMGAPLHVDGRTWGILTLDAMQAESFDEIDRSLLETFVSVAAASIRAAELIGTLESDLHRHQLVQRSWLADSNGYEMIGESASMNRLRHEAETVGNSELPVLVLGETGTGKELVARLIHLSSPRADQPMVQVNCAALPENLAESELFGHVSGAFSGADRPRAGKFELAHGGTLLLDEVGELPLVIQAKLLRALQSGEIQRVGSDEHHHASVRVIAATNRDLEHEVQKGRFRADLYHRLSVYPIKVPPLRDRGNDIILLAGHFLQNCERKFGLRGLRLSREANQWMKSYQWPGNVRELENAISRATIKAIAEGHARNRIIELNLRHLGADPISPAPAPAVSKTTTPPQSTLHDAVEQFKRDLISARLQAHDNNLSQTAQSLGLDRSNFHRMLKKMGLR